MGAGAARRVKHLMDPNMSCMIHYLVHAFCTYYLLWHVTLYMVPCVCNYREHTNIASCANSMLVSSIILVPV